VFSVSLFTIVMCFPFGGIQNILVPPTEKARKIAVAFKVCLVLHFLLIISFFISTQYIDAVMDLFLLALGAFAVKSSDGYSFQQVLCYTVWVGMRFIWEAIRMIVYWAASGSGDGTGVPDATWQKEIYVGSLMAAPIIFTVATVVGWLLYKELRNIIHEMAATMHSGDASDWNAPPPAEGFSYGQRGSGYSEVPQQSSGTTHRGSTQNSTGFKAFSGQGHKLGSTAV